MTCDMFAGGLTELQRKIDAEISKEVNTTERATIPNAEGATTSVGLKDPPFGSDKGPKRRRKSIGEQITIEAKKKSQPKIKQCGACKGTDHDRKTCPELGKKERLPQDSHFVYVLEKNEIKILNPIMLKYWCQFICRQQPSPETCQKMMQTRRRVN